MAGTFRVDTRFRAVEQRDERGFPFFRSRRSHSGGPSSDAHRTSTSPRVLWKDS